MKKVLTVLLAALVMIGVAGCLDNNDRYLADGTDYANDYYAEPVPGAVDDLNGYPYTDSVIG